MKRPIHPIVVHFPIVSWIFSTTCDLLWMWFNDELWKLSIIFLAVGFFTGIVAILTGLYELLNLLDQRNSLLAALGHIKYIVLAWLLYAVSFFLRIESVNVYTAHFIEIGLSVLGLAFLMLGVLKGHDLVFIFRAGMRNK